MKIKLDVSCRLSDVYDKFQIHISEHVEKDPENFLLVGASAVSPLSSICGHQMAKIAHSWRQSIQVKKQCVYQIWRLYITIEAMNDENEFDLLFGF